MVYFCWQGCSLSALDRSHPHHVSIVVWLGKEVLSAEQAPKLEVSSSNPKGLPVKLVSLVLVEEVAKFSWPWAPGDFSFPVEPSLVQPDPGLPLVQSSEMVVVVPICRSSLETMQMIHTDTQFLQQFLQRVSLRNSHTMEPPEKKLQMFNQQQDEAICVQGC